MLAGVRRQAALSSRAGRGQRRQAAPGTSPAWEGSPPSEQGGAGDPAGPGLRPGGGSPPSGQGGAGDPAGPGLWGRRVAAGPAAVRAAALRSAQEVSAPPGVEYPPQADRQREEAGPLKAGALEPPAGPTSWLSGAARVAAGRAEQEVSAAPRGEYRPQADRQREESGPLKADALELPAERTRWLSEDPPSAAGGEPRAEMPLAPRRGPPAQAGTPKSGQAPRSSLRAASVSAGVGCRSDAAAPRSLVGFPRATDTQVPAETARRCHRSVGSAAVCRVPPATGRRSGGAHLEPVGCRPAGLMGAEARRRPAGPLEAEACCRLAGRLGSVSSEAAAHLAKGAWATAAWRHAQTRRRFPDHGSRHLPRWRRQLPRARAPRGPRTPWAGLGAAPGGNVRECSGRDLVECTGKLHNDDLRVRRQRRRFQ